MSVLASTEEGGGCEILTIFRQSRVQLGPGKFHVVVLVLFNNADYFICKKLGYFVYEALHIVHIKETCNLI